MSSTTRKSRDSLTEKNCEQVMKQDGCRTSEYTTSNRSSFKDVALNSAMKDNGHQTNTDKERYDSNPVPSQHNLGDKMKSMCKYVFGDVTDGLKQTLQQYYLKLKFPDVEWETKIIYRKSYLVLKHQFDYCAELVVLGKNNFATTYENIFQKVDKKSPKRILIEGKPGYGKTTLATTIIYDWARSRDYVKSFKLAFLISLRELQQRSVISAVLNIIEMCGFQDSRKAKEIFEDNIANTLLVLDGLDELPVEERGNVLKILYKQTYPDATILVTCKTGFFTLEHDEKVDLFQGKCTKSLFYDKLIRIQGMGSKSKRQFLLNVLDENEVDQIMNNFEKCSLKISELFNSPIFLMLLVKYKKLRKLDYQTNTSGLKSIFNCIISSLGEDFDLCLLHSGKLTAQQELVYKFGNKCAEALLHKNLLFETDDLITEIYKHGFLIKHKDVFEAFHLSILEFAMAFAVFVDSSTDETSSSEKWWPQIQEVYLTYGKSSLLLIFLVGLLQEKSHRLFAKMKPIAHLFSSSEEAFCEILTEIQSSINSQDLPTSLANFFPPNIHQFLDIYSKLYTSDLYTMALHTAIENDKIDTIYINNICSSNLPDDILIRKLLVDILNSGSIAPLTSLLAQIQCKKLAFRFGSGFRSSDENSEAIWNYLCLLASTPAQCRSLSMDGFLVYNVMSDHINDNLIKQIQLSNLRLQLNTDTAKTILKTLIERNQIENVQVLFDYNSTSEDYKQILQPAVASTNLKSLQLHCKTKHDAYVDLHDLTDGGNKCYKLLVIKDCPISCKNQLVNKNCIEAISLKSSALVNASALRMLEPSIMECDACILNQFQSSWSGRDSLKELIILLDEATQKTQFWRDLAGFKNLATLELILPYHGDSDLALPYNDIINCLQSLPIERLVLWRIKAKYAMSKNLINNIAQSFPWSDETNGVEEFRKGPSLKMIDIAIVSALDEEGLLNLWSLIPILLRCLKLSYVEVVNVICARVSVWQSLMQQCVIDHSKFDITHSIHGSCPHDSKYSQLMHFYDDFSVQTHHNFCIKLKKN